MTRAYIMVHSEEFGTREVVKGYLNQIPEISHWRYDLPNCFYLISAASANVLADKLRNMSNKGRFIVLEYTDNSQGWLTKQSWYLLNNKSYMPD